MLPFQSPSLRGSGRFARRDAEERAKKERSQSPSLRGSGRFIVDWTLIGDSGSSQSPSLRGSGRFGEADRSEDRRESVSIPFIAGQWSLLRHVLEQDPDLQGLNPLHCGAVVASHTRRKNANNRAKSQSPSLRGSGRFALRRALPALPPERLNPLHCGAVVASNRAQEAKLLADLVSIPFIAGQWSLRTPPSPEGGRAIRVSIPFIAGQWSLPYEPEYS